MLLKLPAFWTQTKRVLHWVGLVTVPVFVGTQVVSLEIVSGRSMQPILNPNTSTWRDTALFDRWRKWKVQRGDIVTLRSPVNSDTILIKRIIGVAGDRVKTLPPYPEENVVIPEGHIWVEGDERFHSEDSNFFGPVTLGLVQSKLALVVWPPSRFGTAHDRPSHLRWRETRVQKAETEDKGISN